MRDKNPKTYTVRNLEHTHLEHTLNREWINAIKCRYNIGGQRILKQPLMVKAKPTPKIAENVSYGSLSILYNAFYYLFEFLFGNY